MPKFRVSGRVGVPINLHFGPLLLPIDNFGQLRPDIVAPTPESELAVEYARLALPGIIARFRERTGLLRVGNKRSLRRLELMHFVANALNGDVFS